MPKTNFNYSKTIIYKICCKDLLITDIYIGHTTNFIKRKSTHKATCNYSTNKDYNLKVYQFIRENGGWDNWNMIMIEKYPCNNILEATKRERYFFEELKATLNMKTPSRTTPEWNNENRDYKNNQQREYNKKSPIIICECGCELKRTNLSNHIKTKKHQKIIDDKCLNEHQ
jgi:hypothetical protein